MIKYAWARDMPGEHSQWTLGPWRGRGLEIYDCVDQVPQDRILISSHHPPWREPLRSWIAQGRSWIEIEYGYWGPDTPRRETRRVTYCGHHNLYQGTRTHSRRHLFPSPEIRDWRTTPGQYVLGIQPVEVILQERTGEDLAAFRQRLESLIRQRWLGPIVWRRKIGAKTQRWETFCQQVRDAEAVVGERTMACVESCLLGTPAWTVDTSMTTLLMGTWDRFLDGHVPDREQWWEHICWSQFNRTEFDTHTPAEITEQYQILPRYAG